MTKEDPTNTIACISQEISFRDRVGAAAEDLGADFIWLPDVCQITQLSPRHTCMVMDYETVYVKCPSLSTRSLARDHLFLTAITPGDVGAAFRAASEGAAGVFEKRATPIELNFLLSTAFASEETLQRRMEGADRFSTASFAELTDREKAILSHLMNGEPNKRVASLLDIGLRTVEADRAGVMRKLKVDSFAELVKHVTELENDIVNSRQLIFSSMSLGERQLPPR